MCPAVPLRWSWSMLSSFIRRRLSVGGSSMLNSYGKTVDRNCLDRIGNQSMSDNRIIERTEFTFFLAIFVSNQRTHSFIDIIES